MNTCHVHKALDQSAGEGLTLIERAIIAAGRAHRKTSKGPHKSEQREGEGPPLKMAEDHGDPDYDPTAYRDLGDELSDTSHTDYGPGQAHQPSGPEKDFTKRQGAPFHRAEPSRNSRGYVGGTEHSDPANPLNEDMDAQWKAIRDEASRRHEDRFEKRGEKPTGPPKGYGAHEVGNNEMPRGPGPKGPRQMAKPTKVQPNVSKPDAMTKIRATIASLPKHPQRKIGRDEYDFGQLESSKRWYDPDVGSSDIQADNPVRKSEVEGRLEGMAKRDKTAGPLGKATQQRVGAQTLGTAGEKDPSATEDRLGKFANSTKFGAVKKAAGWSSLGHVELHDPSHPNEQQKTQRLTHETAGKMLGTSGDNLRGYFQKNPSAKIPHPEIPGAHFRTPSPETTVASKGKGGGLDRLDDRTPSSMTHVADHREQLGRNDRPFRRLPSATKSKKAVEEK